MCTHEDMQYHIIYIRVLVTRVMWEIKDATNGKQLLQAPGMLRKILCKAFCGEGEYCLSQIKMGVSELPR